MPPLTDPTQRNRYLTILAYWKYEGYVTWKPTAERELNATLTRLPRDVAGLMFEFVRDGGRIDRVPESRPEFDSPCHYDLRFIVDGKKCYFETVMDTEDDAIQVVSFHEGWN